jgi:hypothetical protein
VNEPVGSLHTPGTGHRGAFPLVQDQVERIVENRGAGWGQANQPPSQLGGIAGSPVSLQVTRQGIWDTDARDLSPGADGSDPAQGVEIHQRTQTGIRPRSHCRKARPPQGARNPPISSTHADMVRDQTLELLGQGHRSHNAAHPRPEAGLGAARGPIWNNRPAIGRWRFVLKRGWS